MPCGEDEQHGTSDKMEYESVEKLTSIMLARKKQVDAKFSGELESFGVDRVTKLPHPDTGFELIGVVFKYTENFIVTCTCCNNSPCTNSYPQS